RTEHRTAYLWQRAPPDFTRDREPRSARHDDPVGRNGGGGDLVHGLLAVGARGGLSHRHHARAAGDPRPPRPERISSAAPTPGLGPCRPHGNRSLPIGTTEPCTPGALPPARGRCRHRRARRAGRVGTTVRSALPPPPWSDDGGNCRGI